MGGWTVARADLPRGWLIASTDSKSGTESLAAKQCPDHKLRWDLKERAGYVCFPFLWATCVRLEAPRSPGCLSLPRFAFSDGILADV